MRPLIDAFARGMGDLIAPAWLGLFNAKEFNQCSCCQVVTMTLMLLIYEDIHVTLVATLMQAARSACSGR
jgi:hypothetical protein